MAAPGKPNILVVWGDDIGIWNPSSYSRRCANSRRGRRRRRSRSTRRWRR